MTLADKIVVLNKGRIEQVGSPLELYRHPRNRFVAGFIGSPQMNFLPVTASAVAPGGVTVALPGGDTLLVPVASDGVKPGAALTLGVRPEDLSETGQGDARILGQILVVEHLGGETFAYMKTPDGSQIMVKGDGNFEPHAGDSLSAGVTSRYCHLFSETGAALPNLTRNSAAAA
jgi:multiple sugar transport system ATP-binding protein